MQNLALIDLGAAGIAYIKTMLEKSSLVGGGVVHSFPRDSRCFAFLPDGTSLQNALQFNASFSMRMGSTHAEIAKYVTCNFPGTRIVFEDAWYALEDLKRHPSQQPVFIAGSTVYYAPVGNDVPAMLDAGMRAVHSFVSTGFVVDAQAYIPANGETMTAAEIELFISHVQAVFVSAYDQESYVMWRKS